jgi:hypothetical protein
MHAFIHSFTHARIRPSLVRFRRPAKDARVRARASIRAPTVGRHGASSFRRRP